MYNSKLIALPYKKIQGLEGIKKVIDIDQSPIGRTPRSNPATYTKKYLMILEIYLPKQMMLKWKVMKKEDFHSMLKVEDVRHVMVMVLLKIEMNFLADVYVNCDVCYGSRYNKETLGYLLCKEKYSSKVISKCL